MTVRDAQDPRYADLAEAVLRAARELQLREYNSGSEVMLTSSQAQVMRYIDAHPDATPSEVAEETGLLRTNLSAALRELEKLGFVERHSDPRDGRGVRVRSTSGAAENLSLVRDHWADAASRALGGPDGVLEAARLLEKLADGLVRERRRGGARPAVRQS